MVGGMSGTRNARRAGGDNMENGADVPTWT